MQRVSKGYSSDLLKYRISRRLTMEHKLGAESHHLPPLELQSESLIMLLNFEAVTGMQCQCIWSRVSESLERKGGRE